MSSALRQAIEAAACLCGQRDETLPLSKESGGGDRVQARLESRLRTYNSAIGLERESSGLLTLEDQTGNSALDSLDAIHRALLDQQALSTSSQVSRPILGSRDLKTVQTLLAIISNWMLVPLIVAFDASLSALQNATFSNDAPSKLVELPDEAVLNQRRQTVITRFSTICSRSTSSLDRLQMLLGLSETQQSQISDVVLHSCAPHIIALVIRIAWGPTVQKEDKKRQKQKEDATTFLGKLLRSLSTSSCLKILSASGHVTGSPTKGKSSTPIFVKSATEHLYSAQLLRNDAIMALFSNVFGNEQEQDSDLMKKLSGIGHLLSTPPPNLSIDAFAMINVPRLMDIVSELPTHSVQMQQRSPSRLSTSTHKTAACFALARLYEVAPEALTRCTHDLLWKHLTPDRHQESLPGTDQVHASVQLLYHLVEYCEPSTMFLSFLISPIIIPLFTLCSFLKTSTGKPVSEIDQKGKSAESSLSSMASSLLKTWLRLADVEESCTILSPKQKTGIFATSASSVGPVKNAVDEESHTYWDREDGHITFSRKNSQPLTDLSSALSTLQMKNLQTLLTSNEDAESSDLSLLSALELAPSPPLLASLLKEASRKDVTSHLLSDLLECYSLAKQKERMSSNTENSSDSLLYVQHILEIINVFGSEIISGQAGKILAIINFAIGVDVGIQAEESVVSDDETPFVKSKGTLDGSLAELTSVGRVVQETSEATMQIDEEPDDDLVETALNLLLSLLEGSPDISVESHSLLKLISAKLQWHISKSSNREIRTLAKEARLVITARGLRTASSVPIHTSDTPIQQAFAKGNEMYQEALRLLQDPILPVRAHGLVLLKELAAFGSTDANQVTLMDPALTSAIVDIYMQAIQDDESFLYLNAVKGIAELANTGGKSIIKRLVSLYLGSNFSKEQVDIQLRMGEALLQVIQKLEEALTSHVDEIVHPLLTALRQSNRPTTLRSSYLSILGTCVEACPNAFSATHIGNALIDAMLDLLSIETTSNNNKSSRDDMQDPTNLDTKLPQLRRAAVLLLALFIRGSRHQLELAQEKRDDVQSQEQGTLTSLRMPNGRMLQGGNSPAMDSSNTRPTLMFAEDKTERTNTLLTYIAQTDSDSLVRHQSQQLIDELNLLTLSRIAA